MNDPKNLHQLAMAYFQESLVARHLGDEARANAELRAALDAESRAAVALEMDVENEPTRFILFRSAATLAMDCGEFEMAKSLAYRAMMGKVPMEIEIELQQIYDNAIAMLAPEGKHESIHSRALSGEKTVLSQQDMEQLFQMMGTLSEAEIKLLRTEHSLIERLLNAMATLLLHRNKGPQFLGGEFPISG